MPRRPFARSIRRSASFRSKKQLPMELPWAVLLWGHGAVIRNAEAPDGDIIEKNVAVAHGIILVSFDDLDHRAAGFCHDAHMTGPGGAVTLAPFIPDIKSCPW